MPRTVTDSDLDAFRQKLDAMLAAHHATAKNVGEAPRIEIQMGERYAKLIVKYTGYDATSAYGFVDLTNGDLLEAAGWKAPAKGARGNIYADDPLSGCTPYGMEEP